jgi:Cys-tRNA(Pro)/Cys-tRNA(Cys) deacylase
MPVSTRATRALDESSIPYRIFQHQHLPESLEQAAQERGQDPEQIIRSILFRFAKQEFFLTLVAGPRQVSWRLLRHHLGITRVSMATEEQVLRTTGYAVGTVSPFGLSSPLRILCNLSIFKPEEISLGSGERGLAIIMKSIDLPRALGKIEIGQFC